MDGTYPLSWLPWILIPAIGWLFPLVSMVLLMFYVESDAA